MNASDWVKTLDDALDGVSCYMVGEKICYRSGNADVELTQDFCEDMVDMLEAREYETDEDDILERQDEEYGMELGAVSYRFLLEEMKRRADAKEQGVVTSVTEGWL